LDFCAALARSRGRLLGLARFFTACSITASASMSPPLLDAGARVLIQLWHTPALDFADFAIPDNVLEGVLEYLLTTNDHCGHSVLLELLGSLGSRDDDRLAALSVDLFGQNTVPTLK
jgi:hypothetical protein